MSSLVLDKDHPLSDLMYKKARYKVYWGGRGAAKSQGMAEALVRIASARPVRVLCCREFQNSIKDSSHKLLKDTIEKLGLSTWFTVTADSIRSKVGAEFVFKGLHLNENGIRSMAAIDYCWVEEAHSVSANSWRVLLPTIREDDAEIWISFNMVEENDATYQLFVAQQRTNSIIHKINYDSNPFFPNVLRQEMEDDKRTDYAMYEHIWLGMPRKRSNAIILNNKYVVRSFDDDLWQDADRLFFGADWGFADDPSTLIRCFIIDNKLYIEHEAYEYHVELDDFKEFYKPVPGSDQWPIKADSARPETISHLRGKFGFDISAAEKWPGSVEDGIAHLRKFDQIVIHPRCVKTAEEAYLWRYKVDPKVVDKHGQPIVLPVVVDKNNHCIPAGSLVTTLRGAVPIEQVTTQDKVLTRGGWCRVLWAGATDHDRELLEVRTQRGLVLRCTPDHEVYTARGFKRADALRYNDDILSIEESSWLRGLFACFKVGPTGSTRKLATTSIQRTANGFMSRCGSTIMAAYQRATRFTTGTTTRTTTTSGTLSAFPALSTAACTGLRTMAPCETRSEPTWPKPVKPQEPGTQHQPDSNCIEGLANRSVPIMRQSPRTVSTVASGFRTGQLAREAGSTRTPVSLLSDVIAVLTMRTGRAQCARSGSGSTDTKSVYIVQDRVQWSRVIEQRASVVHDLTIEGHHEFFADGVLVHNCWDAVRYSLDGHITKGGAVGIFERLGA